MKGNKKNNKAHRLWTKEDFLHSFFFIKPHEGTNINELAKALLSIDDVQEVCVTEGDIGYMVKAKFDEKNYEKIEKSIAEVAGPKYGRVVSAMEAMK